MCPHFASTQNKLCASVCFYCMCISRALLPLIIIEYQPSQICHEVEEIWESTTFFMNQRNLSARFLWVQMQSLQNTESIWPQT